MSAPPGSTIMWRIPEWFQDLNDDAEHKLRAFHTELISFNGRINLISPKTEAQADRIHIADAILGTEILLNHITSNRVFDFGAGNGIPGFVFAVLAPDKEVIAVDSDARKIEFLKHCAHRFHVENFAAIHKRVEDLPENSVHTAIARGFAPIPKALLLCRKQIEPGGEIFHFKGEQWIRELASIPPQLVNYWKGEVAGHYTLPVSSSDMTIVRTRKL